MAPRDKRCRYRIGKGRRCRAARLKGKKHCVFHDQVAREQRQRVTGEAPIDLTSRWNLHLWLSEIAQEVRTGKLEPRQGTAIGYLAQIMEQNLEGYIRLPEPDDSYDVPWHDSVVEELKRTLQTRLETQARPGTAQPEGAGEESDSLRDEPADE